MLIAMIALVILGPKRLPEVARTCGRAWGWIRRQQWRVQEVLDKQWRLAQLEDNQAKAEKLDHGD